MTLLQEGVVILFIQRLADERKGWLQREVLVCRKKKLSIILLESARFDECQLRVYRDPRDDSSQGGWTDSRATWRPRVTHRPAICLSSDVLINPLGLPQAVIRRPTPSDLPLLLKPLFTSITRIRGRIFFYTITVVSSCPLAPAQCLKSLRTSWYSLHHLAFVAASTTTLTHHIIYR